MDEPPNVLERPAEGLHGGVVATHGTTAGAISSVVRNQCALVAPSVGIELASTVPAYGDVIFLGGEDTIRQLPSHGVQIFSTDIWSGRKGTVPEQTCEVGPVAPPVAHGEGNCTLRHALAIRRFGKYGMGKILKYWQHPVPGDGPCDAQTDVDTLWRARTGTRAPPCWRPRWRAARSPSPPGTPSSTG